MMRISEFQMKDIVNIADGKKLGNLQDLEIDIKTGQIESLFVSNYTGWKSMFQRDGEHVIPWGRIKKIGTDIIFVEESNLRTIFDEVEKK